MTDNSKQLRGPGNYQHWDRCEACGFQGLILFQCRAGEDYSDLDALGFLMDSSCPACGYEEAVLVVVEQYQEMVRMARRPSNP